MKRAVPGWNGRPVTVGHPKSDDGSFITANDPKVLEDTQIGFIFDAYYRDTDNKLAANVWLDASKLDKFTDVRDAITNEKTLEVSTGLFLDLVTEEGVHSGKKYKGKAVNHLPDHLALLPNEVGACSVADGAGFPRVNVMLGTNEVTFRERSRLIRQALQAKIASGYFYIEEIFDASVVVYKDPAGLSAYDYTLDKETGTLTLGEGVEVFQKIEYPPINTLGTNMNAVKNVDDAVPYFRVLIQSNKNFYQRLRSDPMLATSLMAGIVIPKIAFEYEMANWDKEAYDWYYRTTSPYDRSNGIQKTLFGYF